MKVVLVVASLIFFVSSALAVSIEDVVRLSKLKTNDELILELIQKEGLQKKITSADVVYLKQNGVSDRVIEYMWKLSHRERQKLLPQEGTSTMVAENIRGYTTTTRKGKQVTIYTNLDENGARMGPEAPPEPPSTETAYTPVASYEEPREIRIIVETPERREPQDYYVVDRYTGLSPFDYGYYPSVPYVPYYPYNPFHVNQKKGRFHFQNTQGATWNFDAGYGRPRITPPRTVQRRNAAPASAGTRKMHR